jgi:RNA polymerase sigma-70 factor, ECF subfamily
MKKNPEEIQELALAFYNNRDEISFTKIHNKMYQNLLYFANGIVGDMEVAQDIVNVGMASVWSKIGQYNPYWQFTTWVYRIVRNEALTYKRRAKKHVSLDSLRSSDNSVSDRVESKLQKMSAYADDYITEPNWFLDEDYNAAEKMYGIAIDAMNELPPLYKNIIIDREVNEMKYEEIADKYAMNLNTVKIRIMRSRQYIQKSVNNTIGSK